MLRYPDPSSPAAGPSTTPKYPRNPNPQSNLKRNSTSYSNAPNSCHDHPSSSQQAHTPDSRHHTHHGASPSLLRQCPEANATPQQSVGADSDRANDSNPGATKAAGLSPRRGQAEEYGDTDGLGDQGLPGLGETEASPRSVPLMSTKIELRSSDCCALVKISQIRVACIIGESLLFYIIQHR